MTLAPGSVPWMVRHELRLYWRTGRQVASLTFFIITQVLLHGIALVIAIATRVANGPRLPRAMVLMGITLGLGFALLIMVSRGLTAAIQSLYTRGDLDLLLASPIDPRSIVAVRAAAIALAITLELAVLLWPFANVFVLFGRFAWLKAYLLLPAMGMLATSIALLLMLGLFRVLGPRRTRVAVQIGSALIGMSFMLLWMITGMSRRAGVAGAPDLRNLAASPTGAIWIPAELVLNGFWPTLVFAATCAMALVLTVRSISARFVSASTLLAGVASAGSARGSTIGLRFSGNLRGILIVKELRLIARDPWLLTQLLQQLIFLVPMSIVIWRNQGSGVATPWAWIAVIFACGSLASAFSWLTVSGEDAPELLAASPAPTATLIRAKIEAALLPVLPLILVPGAFLWRGHPGFAATLTACAVGCSISCALLQIRNPKARKRADFKTRHKGSPISGLIEMAVIGAWSLLCAAIIWWGN